MADATLLPVETGVDPLKMAEVMFGQGIKVIEANFDGDPDSAGIYTDADKVAPGVAPSDSGVILSTGRATSITNETGAANQGTGTTTDTKGVDADTMLDQLAGNTTFDGAIFSAKFVPDGSVLTMQITFSSEEYMEFVGSGFNDAVGIWVNGEKAQLTVGDGDISINNINAWSNSGLYIDNPEGALNTEMDGLTVTLTLKASVKAGEVNDIRIGIADAGDASLDSNLMIAADSVQTAVIAVDDSFDIGRVDKAVVDLTGNDTNASKSELTITRINGVPVTAGSKVVLADGILVVVNGDGTITLMTDGDQTAGTTTFSYEVTNAQGISDVCFVHGQVACFVSGARIATERGLVAVQSLEPGDRVLTLDNGYQTLRWRGQRSLASQGAFAAVSIPAGTFGSHGALRVSPQHRLLIRGWQAELYCGEPEVLVKASHLVRAGLLRQDHSGAPVTYCHLLFDQHEIINAEGLWSESYLPGPATLAGHDPQTCAELFAMFPELEGNPTAYGPPARPQADAKAAMMLGRGWS
jgi:hypothetical protein